MTEVTVAAFRPCLRWTISVLLAGMCSGCAGTAGVPDAPAEVDRDDQPEGTVPGDDDTVGGVESDRQDDGSVDTAMPDNPYCNAVDQWEARQARFEEQVLELVNLLRAGGADCGEAGTFAPAGPLRMNAALQCAARRHSLDMADRGFFDHVNPDGLNPGQRIEQAGYQALAWGENIASGHTTPQQVVDGWMTSSGHCANIMNPAFTEIGVGTTANLWTQVFGDRGEPTGRWRPHD